MTICKIIGATHSIPVHSRGLGVTPSRPNDPDQLSATNLHIHSTPSEGIVESVARFEMERYHMQQWMIILGAISQALNRQLYLNHYQKACLTLHRTIVRKLHQLIYPDQHPNLLPSTTEMTLDRQWVHSTLHDTTCSIYFRQRYCTLSGQTLCFLTQLALSSCHNRRSRLDYLVSRFAANSQAIYPNLITLIGLCLIDPQVKLLHECQEHDPSHFPAWRNMLAMWNYCRPPQQSMMLDSYDTYILRGSNYDRSQWDHQALSCDCDGRLSPGHFTTLFRKGVQFNRSGKRVDHTPRTNPSLDNVAPIARSFESYTIPQGVWIGYGTKASLQRDQLPHDRFIAQGDLTLSRYAGSLPNTLHVKGDLVLHNCDHLDSLGNDLKVDGQIVGLETCHSIRLFPQRLEIGGDLDLATNPKIFAQLLESATYLKVGGNLSLQNHLSITHLPQEMVVAGRLLIKNCPLLKRVAEKLTVGAKCSLTKCRNLTHITDKLQVHGELFVAHLDGVTHQLANSIVADKLISISHCPNMRYLATQLQAHRFIALNDCPLLERSIASQSTQIDPQKLWHHKCPHLLKRSTSTMKRPLPKH